METDAVSLAYTVKGVLDLNENEIELLKNQRVIAELFADSDSEPEEPNFEGFAASEVADSSPKETDGTLESDDEMETGLLNDADAAYQTNPNLPDFIHPHGPLKFICI